MFCKICIAQITVQSGATFYVQSGGTIATLGDLISNVDIQGTGTMLFKGSSKQIINMNGFRLEPNLEINNNSNIALDGAMTLEGSLVFINGKLQLEDNNLTLGTEVICTGLGPSKFVETNGSGAVIKKIANNGSFVMPLGNNAGYQPLQLTLSDATLNNASISGRLVTGKHPNKHPRSSDYLNQYWNITSNGLTGGQLSANATYDETDGFTGTESYLKSMTWDGTNWSMQSSQQNPISNTIIATFQGTSGDLYAMNQFVLASPKVFLQGAYSSGGLMNDLLRTNTIYSPGTIPVSNLLPLSDPYRIAPYSSSFTHVQNADVEAISSTILADQISAANNIVDWVFIELRTVNSPTLAPVIQTRSGLLRRDGTIVDIDGISPIYFKNTDSGNYILSIRHRNHLGISMDPGSPISLGLNSTSFNFSNAPDAQIFGSLGSSYTSIGGINLMWGGNVNGNTNARYQGALNDRSIILTDLENNELSTLNGYYRSDINMNRTIKYQGAQNDRAYLLSMILANNELNIRTQALPN